MNTALPVTKQGCCHSHRNTAGPYEKHKSRNRCLVFLLFLMYSIVGGIRSKKINHPVVLLFLVPLDTHSLLLSLALTQRLNLRLTSCHPDLTYFPQESKQRLVSCSFHFYYWPSFICRG